MHEDLFTRLVMLHWRGGNDGTVKPSSIGTLVPLTRTVTSRREKRFRRTLPSRPLLRKSALSVPSRRRNLPSPSRPINAVTPSDQDTVLR